MSWLLNTMCYDSVCAKRSTSWIVDPGPSLRMWRLWRLMSRVWLQSRDVTNRHHFPIGCLLDSFVVREVVSVSNCSPPTVLPARDDISSLPCLMTTCQWTFRSVSAPLRLTSWTVNSLTYLQPEAHNMLTYCILLLVTVTENSTFIHSSGDEASNRQVTSSPWQWLTCCVDNPRRRRAACDHLSTQSAQQSSLITLGQPICTVFHVASWQTIISE